jgi:hypothetical protein
MASTPPTNANQTQTGISTIHSHLGLALFAFTGGPMVLVLTMNAPVSGGYSPNNPASVAVLDECAEVQDTKARDPEAILEQSRSRCSLDSENLEQRITTTPSQTHFLEPQDSRAERCFLEALFAKIGVFDNPEIVGAHFIAPCKR